MIQKGSRGIFLTTVEQLRAARALLGWSQTELASRAGLSLPTVTRVEGGFGPNVSEESRLRLRQALEAAGLQLFTSNPPGGASAPATPRAPKRHNEPPT